MWNVFRCVLSHNRPISLQDHDCTLLTCMGSLAANRIGEEGAEELLNALQVNKTLAKLE